MLTLFLSQVYADAFSMSEPKNASSFDILFHPSQGKRVSVTYGNRGFFAAMNITDEEGVTSRLQILQYKNRAGTQIGDVTVKWSGEFDTKTKLYTVKFTIHNDGYFPKKINLGIFADCGFDDDDNAPISLLGDGRGFWVASGTKYNYTTFIRDFGEFPNVDTFYLGDMPNSLMYDPAYYPYFKDETIKRTTADSVFAFSWLNKEVLGESEITLGFTLGAGVNFNTPPHVFDVSKLQAEYSGWEPAELKFMVVDYDNADSIDVYVKEDDKEPQKLTPTFNPTESVRSKNYTHQIFVTSSLIRYECYAVDSQGLKSNVVKGVIRNTAIPKISKFTPPKQTTFYPYEKLKLSLEARDEDVLDVLAQFDNGLIKIVRKYDPNGWETPDFEMSIPRALKTNRNHTLYLWVKDKAGAVSKKVEFTFTLDPPNAPELISVYASDPAYIRGRTEMIVFGEVTDKDIGQIITISGRPGPSYPSTELGKHLIEQNNPPFAFLYDIPKDVPAGLHDLMFDVIDDTNTTGKGNSVKVRVCEPDTDCYEPGEEPTAKPVTPSTATQTSNIDDKQDDDNANKYKSKMPVIWVLTVFNIIAVIILLVIGVFWIRKKMVTYEAFKDDTTTEGDEEISESCITPAPGSVSQTVDNPLFSSGIPQSDDVFANDYHEETTVDVFKFNNDEDDPDLGI